MDNTDDRSNRVAGIFAKRIIPVVVLIIVLMVSSSFIISFALQAHEELSFAIARDIYKQGVSSQIDMVPTNTLEGFPWWVYACPIIGTLLVFTINKYICKTDKSYVAVSTIIVLVLFGLIMIATTYGYYMLNMRKAVELKYSNGNRYWQTDDIETIPKEIADLV